MRDKNTIFQTEAVFSFVGLVVWYRADVLKRREECFICRILRFLFFRTCSQYWNEAGKQVHFTGLRRVVKTEYQKLAGYKFIH